MCLMIRNDNICTKSNQRRSIVIGVLCLILPFPFFVLWFENILYFFVSETMSGETLRDTKTVEFVRLSKTRRGGLCSVNRSAVLLVNDDRIF